MERGKHRTGARAGALLVAAVTAAVFSRALDYPFLNWDDQDVFVRNDALRAPGLAAWAFTTRYMEHYQPLAWLTWAAVGVTPSAAHALNVGLHLTCAVLVYLLARRVTGPWPAVFAALFWAIHPLRVEPVAWASAMPYALALLFALLATIAWLEDRAWTAVGLFALSLLARPVALGLPIVFVVIGPAFAKASARKPVCFALLLAIAFAAAESSARLAASLAEFGIGARLTLAATAPFLYLWRTIAPVNLTPLDPLALTPRTDPTLIVLGLTGVVLISAAAWKWRREQPVLALAWLAYLALLVPAAGLVPSGLQATADRYSYLPGVPLAIATVVAATKVAALRAAAIPIGTSVRSAATRSAAALATAFAACAAVVLVVIAALTWQQMHYWRDSVTLWSRALDIDATNDVALYNLAAALEEDGRTTDAIARYEQVLAIVPDHADARRNRDRLSARMLENDANRLAAAGHLEEAVTRYSEAVRLDDRRSHSHAALGIALTRLGRLDAARPHLQAALNQGVTEAAVFNALAYGMMQAGDRAGALALLRQAQRAHPADADIARNIALLSQR